MKKINKKEARKRFNNGETIILLPCRANIESFWWAGGYKIHNKMDEYFNEFDDIVTMFEHYNCSYEVGFCASYYTEQ